MNKTWHVQRLQSKRTIRNFLERDRGYGAYALGDLEAPHWDVCEFFGVKALDNVPDEPQSLVLRYYGFETPLLVVFGESAGVEVALAQILDEHDVYFTASEALYPLLAPYYNLPDSRHMWRRAVPCSPTLRRIARKRNSRAVCAGHPVRSRSGTTARPGTRRSTTITVTVG